jgi:predicted nucleic acid-binding protein
MTTFVDTNVLIYLLDENSPFHEWSVAVFAARKEQGPVIINDVVYSEFSVMLDSIEATDQAISSLKLERSPFTNEMLFRAGKAYFLHQQNGGNRSNVLPDFFIGAQAEIDGAPLLTANGGDFRTYFPEIELITPP